MICWHERVSPYNYLDLEDFGFLRRRCCCDSRRRGMLHFIHGLVEINGPPCLGYAHGHVQLELVRSGGCKRQGKMPK
jgi:hypothetical protein